MRDQGRVAGEGKEATDDGSDRGRAAQLPFVQPRQPGNRLWEGDTGIDQRLKRVDELQRPHSDRAQLADSACLGRKSRRLQVEDHELGLLQQRVRSARERNRRAGTHDPAVAAANLAEERGHQPGRDRAAREQEPGGFDRGERPLLLQRGNEPIEAVERKLHPCIKANIRSVCKHRVHDGRSDDPACRRRRVLRVCRAARRSQPARTAGDRRRRRRARRQLRSKGVRRPDGDGRKAGQAALPGCARRRSSDGRLRRGEPCALRALRGHDPVGRGALDRRSLPRRPGHGADRRHTVGDRRPPPQQCPRASGVAPHGRHRPHQAPRQDRQRGREARRAPPRPARGRAHLPPPTPDRADLGDRAGDRPPSAPHRRHHRRRARPHGGGRPRSTSSARPRHATCTRWPTTTTLVPCAGAPAAVRSAPSTPSA